MNGLALLVASLCLITVGLIVGLLFLRFTSDLRERRRARRHAQRRDQVMMLIMGEPEEAAAAQASLDALPPSAWPATEEQIFALLPKVRGESRLVLVGLLSSRGAAERARQLLSSRSVVRRCRGAYRLGALHPADATASLLPRLGDHSFLVRRVTVRALGSVADPEAVGPLFDSCGSDTRLTRDLVSALERIGTAGAPRLREVLAVPSGRRDARHAEIAAIVLGLLGDVSAVPLLLDALGDEAPGLRAAAAEALGRIGVPQAIPGLTAALDEPEELVRRSAAAALGDIGDPRAAEGLDRALTEASRLTSRAIAAALLALGDPGRETLRRNPSPYAAEALAVQGLRGGLR
ncbi:HEAT repeat domain-containing protein [Nocardioides donggukensis]|uniref:HEAT repeat domain-containing protein n=1 Tax=Nocardioides donggukensis TaxID=2774019 RepID=A0A927K568_9ACTN|nr:HEAT repeat domain-containing protein [Nocardioides donggukensis]MBD8870111.1 HEAT repeat domain-containing protein [Nocardioides donggukensis]